MPVSKLEPYYQYPRPEVVQLVPASARRILDIGCASGRVGAAIKKRQKCEVWGIESNVRAAKEARICLDQVFIGDFSSLAAELPKAGFDVIIMADVLEHIVDTERTLAIVSGLLATGGELILSLPNTRHWSVLRMLLGGDWRYEDSGLLDRTHVRFFTAKSSVRMLRNAGFKIEKMSGVSVTRPPPDGFISGLEAALEAAGMNHRGLAAESNVFQFLFKCTFQDVS